MNTKFEEIIDSYIDFCLKLSKHFSRAAMRRIAAAASLFILFLFLLVVFASSYFSFDGTKTKNTTMLAFCWAICVGVQTVFKDALVLSALEEEDING
jgi:hypothetical protein